MLILFCSRYVLCFIFNYLTQFLIQRFLKIDQTFQRNLEYDKISAILYIGLANITCFMLYKGIQQVQAYMPVDGVWRWRRTACVCETTVQKYKLQIL